MRGLALAVLLVGVASPACDNRACLAQSDLFASYRPELIAECCACLAKNGTVQPGAACAEAFVDVDGGQAILVDAGPAIPDTAPDVGDNNNDVVDPGEVPCLCAETEASCIQRLTDGKSVTVTGSCVDQGGGIFRKAPCEDACKGVLTFDPLQGQ